MTLPGSACLERQTVTGAVTAAARADLVQCTSTSKQPRKSLPLPYIRRDRCEKNISESQFKTQRIVIYPDPVEHFHQSFFLFLQFCGGYRAVCSHLLFVHHLLSQSLSLTQSHSLRQHYSFPLVIGLR